MRISFVVLTLSALGGAMTAAMAAQPSGLPVVPAGLSQQQTDALSQQRARIAKEGERVQLVVENHHAQCAHVGLPPASGETPDPNEAALKEHCDAEQVQIDKQVHQYAADAMAYRRSVDAAVAAGAKGQNAYAARVVLKGSVHLVQPSGALALASSRVIQLTSGERVTTGPHSRASFQLPDKSVFVLGPDADVALTTMVNSPTPAQRRVVLSLDKGVLHWTSGNRTSAGAARVRKGGLDFRSIKAWKWRGDSSSSKVDWAVHRSRTTFAITNKGE